MTSTLTERHRLLTLAHLPLVPPIARKAARSLPSSFEIADLISIGNFGLMRAAMKYRPRKYNNAPFSAYARKYIRFVILDGVRRRRREEAVTSPLEDDAGVYTNAVYADPFTSRRLAGAVAALPAKLRAVIVLYYSEKELSLREVAALAGAGYGKSRASKLHGEAIRALRVALAA